VRHYWVVHHPHVDSFLARAETLKVWTRDLDEAERFSTEDSALDEIIRNFGGRGHALRVDDPPTLAEIREVIRAHQGERL
jgi:hypothetical protein